MELDCKSSVSETYIPATNRLVYLLVILTFLLIPVYILASGGPQLVDIPILAVIVYVFLTTNRNETQLLSLPFMAFFTFGSWAICVNIYYFMTTYHLFLIQASLQLCYIIMLFFSFTILFVRMLNNKDVIPFIYTGVLLATITPLFITGKPESGFTVREALSFNNPNQLTYFAVIIMAIILVLNNCFTKIYENREGKPFIILTSVVTIILTHYFVLLSASRAGLLSVVLLDMIAVYKASKKALLAILMAIFVVFLFFGDRSVIEHNLSELHNLKIVKRFMSADLSSLLAERTEARFVVQDFSIIFGNGKTKGILGKKEVHNTLADILYSYGLIGFCLFSIFLAFYLKQCISDRFQILILLAFIPVHISHNFGRCRMIWIFYALVYSISLILANSPQSRMEEPQTMR